MRLAFVAGALLSVSRAVAVEFTVELQPGWNLVSVPVLASDPSPDALFGAVKRGRVWEWDADAGVFRVATEIVPGILFANKKIRMAEPHLYDLAPTILSEFGIPEPEDMIGGNIFGEPMPLDEKGEEEARKKLKTLGYM